MSLISSSYHLRSNNQADGVALLHRSQVPGFVLPSQDEWVTVLAEEPLDGPNEDVLRASEGRLLYLSCSEDFGWTFSIFANGTRLFQYTFDAEGDHDAYDEPDEEVIRMLIPADADSNEFRKALQKILHPDIDNPLFNPALPAAAFAALVGLPSLEILSYDSFKTESADVGGLILGAVPVNHRLFRLDPTHKITCLHIY